MRLLLAVQIFFRVLFDRTAAEAIRGMFASDSGTATSSSPAVSAPPTERRPALPAGRSDSLTLLAALQREARFIDFVNEPLEGFSDAQIGAAARDVHRDCGQLLQRWFGIEPVSDEPEGAEVEVASGYDPGRWKLTGNVQGEPPFRGRLAHHGWQASKCDVPQWSGSQEAARTVAPVEVELS